MNEKKEPLGSETLGVVGHRTNARGGSPGCIQRGGAGPVMLAPEATEMGRRPG